MTRSTKLAFTILVLSAWLSFSAMVLITAAHAEFVVYPMSAYCASSKEFKERYAEFSPTIRSDTRVGEKYHGEVWTNPKTDEWFFAQSISNADLICGLLQGKGALLPVDQSKEGQPL